MKSRSKVVSLLLICAALVISTYGTVAYGDEDNERIIRFNAITSESEEAAEIGENQLRLNVIPGPAPNQKIFEFQNSGSENATVTDILFDDERLAEEEASNGVLAALVVPTITPELAFTIPFVTPQLEEPFLVSPPFVTTSGLALTAITTEGGLERGETLRVTTFLRSGVTNAEVLEALETGRLRVGLHVEGFPNEETAEFVNITTVSPVIPAPAALLLGSVGVGLVGLLRQRRML